MRVIFFIIASAIILAGCGETTATKKAILEVLKDPDSAKFDEITIEGRWACLTVNSKNSLGGYVGRKQYVVKKGEAGKWELFGDYDQTHQECVKDLNTLIAKEAAEASHRSAMEKITKQNIAELSKRFCEGIEESLNDPNYPDHFKEKQREIQKARGCK